jgi:hypothetical protein
MTEEDIRAASKRTADTVAGSTDTSDRTRADNVFSSPSNEPGGALVDLYRRQGRLPECRS